MIVNSDCRDAGGVGRVGRVGGVTPHLAFATALKRMRIGVRPVVIGLGRLVEEIPPFLNVGCLSLCLFRRARAWRPGMPKE